MKKTYLWLLAAAVVVGLAVYFTVTCFGPDRARHAHDTGRPARAATAPRDRATPDRTTPPEAGGTGGVAAGPAPAGDKAMHTLAGTIFDADKKPVAAAELILLSGACTDETARTATTDPAGKFRFDNVQAAAIELVLKRPPNGTPWCLGKVEVSSKTPKELANLEFTLEKACTWTIETKDDKDKPLAGVSLTLCSNNSEDLDRDDCPQALGCSMKTDEQGRATFSDLQPGGYRLAARLEAYGTVMDAFGCDADEPQEKPMVVELGAGGPIVGKVLDPNNQPAGDATVTCYVEKPYYFDRDTVMAAATCDAEGRFRIADLPEGRYLLVASAEAFSDGYLPEVRVTPGRQRPECTILLEPAAQLEGRVIDTAQRPVEGAVVELERTFSNTDEQRRFGPRYGWGGKDFTVAEVTTGADGKFRFDKAPTRDGRVTASKDGYRSRHEQTTSGGQPITIVLVPGPVVAGTVTLAETGKPVEKATVYCLSDMEDAETDAQGRYTLTTVSPGPQTFIAYAPGLASRALVKANVLNAGTVELDFALEPNAQITGVVTDARTGEPIEGAHINALAQKKPQRTSRRWDEDDDDYEDLFQYADPFEAYTDEQGSFKIPVSLPELTIVLVEADDYVGERVELEGKDLTQPLQIQLKQGAVIAGCVLAPDGTPAAEARVTCRAHRGEQETEWDGETGFGYAYTEERATDENGRFRVGARRPGAYVLYATHEDFAPGQCGPVVLSADQVLDGIEIVLAEGGRIAGAVTDETGAPVEDATVSFVVDAEETRRAPGPRGKGAVYFRRESSAPGSVTTDIDGRYTSAVLEPGPYSVSAQSPPLVCREPHRVVVEAASTVTDVNFTLEPGVETSGKVLDEQGNPIAGAQVTLAHDDWVRTDTGEDGTFVFQGLRLPESESESVIYVTAEGYLDQRQTCTVPAQGLEIKLELGGTFVGRVVDKLTKKPVEVFYAAADEHDEPPPMEYHPEGRFKLSGLDPTEHTITVIADGYATATVKDAKVRKGVEAEEVLVELVEGTTLTIVVTSALDGRPVPDVEISSDEALDETTVTDADGKCVVKHLAAGRYEFDLEHEAFATKELRVKINEDETSKEVRVALDRGLTIRGQVVSKADQQPIEGATVALVESGTSTWDWYEGEQFEVETGPGGEFSFEYVSPGRYTLSVEHADFSPFQEKTRFEKGFDEPILIELSAGGRIVGTVTDTAGVPQADITIMLLSFGFGGDEHEADTDENGDYVIPHLSPGSYRVAVEPEAGGFGNRGPAIEIKRTTVRDGLDSRVDFVIGSGAAVYGTVTRSGRPVPEVYVTAIPKGASVRTLSGSIGHARADKAGQYRLEGLQPGTYSLWISAGRGLRTDHEFTIGDKDLLLDVDLGGGRIAGWVYDELGRPLNEAHVGLVPEIKEGDTLTGIYSYFRMSQEGAGTDESGAFTLEDVGPGTYRLYAEADGYATQVLTVVKHADADPPPLHIRLQEQGRIVGRVRTQGGKLPEHLAVFVCDAKGRLLMAEMAEIDSDTGEWKLGGTGPGRCTITAKAPGYAPVTKEIAVSRDQDTPVELDLREGNDIVVTVRDSSGRPVPGAAVTVKTGGDPLLAAALNYASLYEEGDGHSMDGTDVNGAMALHHLGDGEHTVHVVADGYEPADAKVRVAGNVQNVTVTLKPAKPGDK